jgi:hypothetical protein
MRRPNRDEASPFLVWLAWMLGAAVMVLYIAHQSMAHARDLGQWKYQSPDISEWFQSLKMPDAPTTSCCGASDAYWADKTESGPHGETIAIITDTRPDEPLMRPHIEIGTRVVVPANKVRKPATFNPTGHTIIFVGASGNVYCYEPLPLY